MEIVSYKDNTETKDGDFLQLGSGLQSLKLMLLAFRCKVVVSSFAGDISANDSAEMCSQ
jgi:hypothetical protein